MPLNSSDATSNLLPSESHMILVTRDLLFQLGCKSTQFGPFPEFLEKSDFWSINERRKRGVEHHLENAPIGFMPSLISRRFEIDVKTSSH